MNKKSTTRLSTFITAVALLSGLSLNAQAQQYGPTAAPFQAPVQAPMQTAPRQAAPMQTAPRQVAPMQTAPRQAAPMQTAPRQSAPVMPAPRYSYGNPYRSNAPAPYRGNRAPYQGNRAPYYANRYNRGPSRGNRSFGPWGGNRTTPWGGKRKGFGRGLPIDVEGNYIPWSRRFWDELGEGGKNPFRDMGDWFDPDEPREGLSKMWDDTLNAPHDMGRMPGGWTNPSISVPNPVTVQQEFENAAKDMPDEMRTQMDNINIQTW